MGWNPFKKSSWTSVGNAIVDTGNSAAKAAEDAANAAAAEAKRQADAAAKAAADAAAAAKKAADDAAREAQRQADAAAKAAKDAAAATKKFADTLAKDTAKAVTHTTAVVAKSTTEYANQGFDVASDTWKQGSAQVVAYSQQGLEYAEYAAEEAYKWADANACYIGLNTALTMGCVAYFTPKPAPGDPGTVTSTAISATYLGWLAVQGSNTAMAMTIGGLLTEGFMLIPGVKGQVDKKTLNNVLVNVIATCNPAVMTVSLATPAGVGIFVGSVVSPIVSQLVCDKVAPKGFTKAIQ